MRTAVIYSGFLRLWERMLNSNKAYLFTPETDLFFYTYEEPVGIGYKQYVHIPTPTHKEHVYYGEEYYEKIRDMYEENKVFDIRERANILQQWHNNFIAFCLVPDDYDVYVRSRGDIILKGKIDFTQYTYPEKRIYIPTAIDWGGVNDQFAFGGYKAMKVYYSLYTEYFKKYGYLVPLYPEHALAEHLVGDGMEVVRINIEHTLER